MEIYGFFNGWFDIFKGNKNICIISVSIIIIIC